MRSVNLRALRVAAICAILLVVSSSVSAARQERRIDGWKPVRFLVSLKFDDKLETLSSVYATITIVALKDGLRTVDLDFGEMSIDTVEVEGKRAVYRHGGGHLDIDLPAALRAGGEISITAMYHGRPTDGLIFSRDRDGQATAVGDNWPDRVHNWIPCLDHPSAKAPVTFTVTASSQNLVVANGRLFNTTENADKTRSWTYLEPAPISPYNMIVAVGPFARGELANAVPLWWYVPKSDAPFAPKGFASASAAVNLFSQLIAPFPYPKLALIVGATRFGGMENAGAIVFTQSLFSNFAAAPKVAGFDAPESVIDVVAHETAHQWFGDSVTESTWADLWLSEGFATYFSGLFRERTQGGDSFRSFMDDAATAYFNYEKTTRTPIHDTETVKLLDLLNPNNYQKGAWILHMLRGQLGDKDFFTGIGEYYLKHRNGLATTDDLRQSLEKASGKDLREFFTRWIYGAGHPDYRVTWRWLNGRPGRVNMMVTQTQPDAAFLTPITIEFSSGKTIRREVLIPTGKSTGASFRFAARPDQVRLDPDGFILKESTVTETRSSRR